VLEIGLKFTKPRLVRNRVYTAGLQTRQKTALPDRIPSGPTKNRGRGPPPHGVTPATSPMVRQFTAQRGSKKCAIRH